MHPDIAKAIAVLDQRIAALTEIRARLSSEFSDNGIATDSKRASQTTHASSTRNGGTRKEALVSFLKTTGPSTRREILEQTRMPEGTIATCLNDRERFRRRNDGRWEVIEQQ